eukprot:364349-Chlamydomonas_euryale.AAC.9
MELHTWACVWLRRARERRASLLNWKGPCQELLGDLCVSSTCAPHAPRSTLHTPHCTLHTWVSANTRTAASGVCASSKVTPRRERSPGSTSNAAPSARMPIRPATAQPTTGTPCGCERCGRCRRSAGDQHRT